MNGSISTAMVLVVDDDPAIAVSIEKGLTENGYHVHIGHNGIEGVNLVRELSPDLILLDIMMPEMDGIEACRQIRKLSQTPIIMLTSQQDENDIIQALELGADAYLKKPIGLNELIARMKAILRRHQYEQQQAQFDLDTVKQRLMSTMTHELRTPIATIMNTLDLALISAYDHDHQKQLQFLTNVKQNTHNLKHLVDDLLFLSRLDEGLTIWRRSVHVHDEIGRFLAEMHSCLEARRIRIICEVPENVRISADQTYFRQALHHLLDNAIKFSPDGGNITIKSRFTSDDMFVLSIADQGPGIATEFHHKIFDRFYQIDNGDNRSHNGLGIGLTVARQIARIHGGDIHLESIPGKGSRFHMAIPVTEPDWVDDR